MAATTIDHLLRTVQSNAIGVAYIYCNYKAKADQNTTTLLAAILKQLVRTRPSIAEPVTRLYDLHQPSRPGRRSTRFLVLYNLYLPITRAYTLLLML